MTQIAGANVVAGGGGGGTGTITSPDNSIEIGSSAGNTTLETNPAINVRSVNGTTPDGTGNVTLAITPGSVNLKVATYATTINNPFSTTANTFDGVTIANDQRWLLLGQSSGAQDNIYVVTGSTGAWTWAVASDCNSQSGLLGAIVNIQLGSDAQSNGVGYAGNQYQLTTGAPIVVGTTPLSWQQTATGVPIDPPQTVAGSRTLDFTGTGAMPGDRFNFDMPTGWTAASAPLSLSNCATQISNTSPMCLLVGIYLPLGFTFGHIHAVAANTASGPTHWWFGIADASLNGLAFSADQTTTVPTINADTSLAIATAWNGSSYAAATTWTTTYGGRHYLIFDMTATTTVVQLVANTASATVNGLTSPPFFGQSSVAASLTGPPSGSSLFSFGTLTAKGPIPFVGVGN
jgi:hypothetical protein